VRLWKIWARAARGGAGTTWETEAAAEEMERERALDWERDEGLSRWLLGLNEKCCRVGLALSGIRRRAKHSSVLRRKAQMPVESHS
jgi:hypothetical protein